MLNGEKGPAEIQGTSRRIVVDIPDEGVRSSEGGAGSVGDLRGRRVIGVVVTGVRL